MEKLKTRRLNKMCQNCFEKLPLFNYKGNQYITWLDDENYFVGFSQIPAVSNKIINKQAMTIDEIKRAKAKPLYLKNTINVCLIDKSKNKTYTFIIKAGYDYDGASINRSFWRLVGSKEDIRFKIAALIHDVLCENHHYVDKDRYFADKIFERCLYAGDTCGFVRWMMFHSVDNFQKFCRW